MDGNINGALVHFASIQVQIINFHSAEDTGKTWPGEHPR